MDLRVEKTYRSLTNEFMSLLEEKSFEDITVAELCNRAMIRRTTFYKHFADKNEFLVFFVKEIRSDFAQKVESENHDSNDIVENCINMMNETLQFLEGHGKLVDNTLSSQSAPLILEALGDVIYGDILKRLASNETSRQSEDKKKMLATFVSGGITKMMLVWCHAGRPEAMKEVMAQTLQSAKSLFREGTRAQTKR